MLKLTKKADYALMAMKHLAEHPSEVARSAKDVAEAYGIPPEALAKILQRLAKAGLLQSQHGTNGGYTLARPAHTISAYEVIRAIDGPLFITSCITVRGECDQSDRCNIREPLRKVNDSIEAVLKRIKISHMREEPEETGSVAHKAGGIGDHHLSCEAMEPHQVRWANDQRLTTNDDLSGRRGDRMSTDVKVPHELGHTKVATPRRREAADLHG